MNTNKKREEEKEATPCVPLASNGDKRKIMGKWSRPVQIIRRNPDFYRIVGKKYIMAEAKASCYNILKGMLHKKKIAGVTEGFSS